MQPWNAVRCADAPHRGHVESYFLKLNDREGRRALWIKATIFVRHGGSPRLAEAWAVAFDREGRHVAVKQTQPLADARFGQAALDIAVCNLVVEEGRISGAVESGGSRIAVDLRFTTGSPAMLLYPARLYRGRFPTTKAVSPHPDSRFRGTYTVTSAGADAGANGGGTSETIEVDDWRGMQGHNWGPHHTELYAWGHVNQWEDDDDLVFEGGTGRVRVGGLLVPPLSALTVRVRGVRYDFNGPVAIARARGAIQTRRWSFAAKTSHATLTGELWADTRDFVGLSYANPDGSTTYCLNSKIARGRLRLSVRGRPDIEVMTRAAALEIGTKDPSHGVTMLA
jgi:hypothetical protein